MTQIRSCSKASASMLEISRKGKQLKKVSYGTCGGRSLVDGVEPESASMLSTVNLELTSFINPQLTWKKGKKGCRSTNRRSRKSINRNLNIGAEPGNKSCKRDQDSSVSESEQLGVAVLGRRFAEKVVDVPIKKRRISIRSPSPPPLTPSLDHEGSLSPQQETPSPCPEDSEQLVDSKSSDAVRHYSSGFHSNCKELVLGKSPGLMFEGKVDGVRKGKKAEVINAGYAHDGDFSGIELLAAAACNSSFDYDVKLKEKYAVKAFAKAEAVDVPNTIVPFKESIASSGTSYVFEKDLVNGDDMGDYAFGETTPAVSVTKNDNGGILKNRAHWDLNTVMEAWEEPDDVAPVNSQINCSEIIPDGTKFEEINLGSSVVQRNLEDIQCEVKSVVCKEITSDVGGHHEFAEGNNVVTAARSCVRVDALNSCPFLEGTCAVKQDEATPSERAQEPLNAIVSIPITVIEASGDHLCPRSQHSASLHVPEEKMNASDSELEQAVNVSCGASVEQKRNLLLGPEAGKVEISTPNIQLLNNIVDEINDTQIEDCDVFENRHGSPNSRTCPRQMISTLSCKTSEVENTVDELDRANLFHPSPKGDALSASSTSVVIGDVKLLADKASVADNTVNDVALQIEPMELTNKISNSPGKIDPENQSSDCYDSYANQDGKKTDMDHISAYEAGYDSSFEDGELRDPGVYNWEENDLEGETEHVDYGSEYGDGDDFDTVNYSKSVNVENDQDVCQNSEKGISLVNIDGIEKVSAGGNRSVVDGDSVKSLEQSYKVDTREGGHLARLKTKISGGDQFNTHLQYGVAEGYIDRYNDKGLAGEFRSRAFRGKLSSFGGGPPYDAMERKISLGLHRNRYDNSNYPHSRTERDYGLEKSMGSGISPFKPFGGRNEADGRWDNSSASYRDTRNRYPHSYRGLEGNAYSRPRDSTATSDTKIGGQNCEDDRRSINYPSNGAYRSFIGRRSPADRDDSYVGQKGIPPARGFGQDRSRGRSGQYVREIRRGLKDEYSEDIHDDADVYSARRQPYISRRERGFSPSYGGSHFSRSRRNSCSRSRTRSPVAWNSQRDRNMNTRRHSPDFRSDARMERRRSPFQKTSFGAENEEGFMSPPRGRASPRNSRWFNDGNYMENHFRDERSPDRMFRRSQRLDSIGYSGRKPNGIFRPSVNRRRFEQVANTGRGHDLDVSDDERRKQDERYEISHRVRRYDAGGAVRRFRYDAEDCYDACNSRNGDGFRRATQRDIPRNGAGEGRGLRYNSDRGYASGSSTVQRDIIENAEAREE